MRTYNLGTPALELSPAPVSGYGGGSMIVVRAEPPLLPPTAEQIGSKVVHVSGYLVSSG